MQATASRLALTNRARDSVYALARAGQAKDADAMFGWYSDGFSYDDRRRLSGDPITTAAALRIAQERILAQYSRFDFRTFAVRGERLHLGWGRWSNDAGFETAHLTSTRSATTGASNMRGALTRTISRARIANSTGATTPEKAQRSPKRVRRRLTG